MHACMYLKCERVHKLSVQVSMPVYAIGFTSNSLR